MLIGLKNIKLGLNSARRLHIEGVPMLGHRKRNTRPAVLICSTDPLVLQPTPVVSCILGDVYWFIRWDRFALVPVEKYKQVEGNVITNVK